MTFISVIVQILLYNFLLFCKVDAQIASAARMQPILGQISAETCCSLLDGLTDISAVLECVNSTSSVQSSYFPPCSRKEGWVTTYMTPEEDRAKHFAVPDIMEFGVYQAANTVIFAEQNNIMRIELQLEQWMTTMNQLMYVGTR